MFIDCFLNKSHIKSEDKWSMQVQSCHPIEMPSSISESWWNFLPDVFTPPLPVARLCISGAAESMEEGREPMILEQFLWTRVKLRLHNRHPHHRSLITHICIVNHIYIYSNIVYLSKKCQRILRLLES